MALSLPLVHFLVPIFVSFLGPAREVTGLLSGWQVVTPTVMYGYSIVSASVVYSEFATVVLQSDTERRENS